MWWWWCGGGGGVGVVVVADPRAQTARDYIIIYTLRLRRIAENGLI